MTRRSRHRDEPEAAPGFGTASVSFASPPRQLLGRLPWFAELFLRAFFLRDFLAMVGLLFVACFPQRW